MLYNPNLFRERTDFSLDYLSSTLSLLKPRSYVSAGLDAGRDWSLKFPAHQGIKFNAVVRGSCWVSVDGSPGALRLEQGDCFLLTRGRPFCLTSDPLLDPIDSQPIYDAAKNGIATCNGGGEFFLVGARFAFSNEYASVLFGALPPVVHLRQASDQASVLRWSLDLFATEVRSGQPGGVLMSEHLAHIMLVQVLRRCLEAPANECIGLFLALSHPQIGAAMSAMHADPSHRWSLGELCRLARMSRSTFSYRFRQLVGVTPIEYLTRWRMLIAGDRLRSSDETLTSIAFSLGYESESAFSTAFKRMMACSPSQYKRQALSTTPRS